MRAAVTAGELRRVSNRPAEPGRSAGRSACGPAARRAMPYTVRTPAFRGCMGGAIDDAHTRRVITRTAQVAEESEGPDASSPALGETAGPLLSPRGAASTHGSPPPTAAPESPPGASAERAPEPQAPSPEPELPAAAHAEPPQTVVCEALPSSEPAAEEPAAEEPAAGEAEAQDRTQQADADLAEDTDAAAEQIPQVEAVAVEAVAVEAVAVEPAPTEAAGCAPSTEAVTERPACGREVAPSPSHRPPRIVHRPHKYDHVKSRLHHVTAACRAKLKSNDKTSPAALRWSGPVVAAAQSPTCNPDWPGEESSGRPTPPSSAGVRAPTAGSQSGVTVLRFRAPDGGSNLATTSYSIPKRPWTRGSHALGSQDSVFPMLPKGPQPPAHFSHFSRLDANSAPSPRTFSALKPRFGLPVAKGSHGIPKRLDAESFLREIIAQQ